MFSRTTIASSMRMPIASERPSSDIVFSVKPKAQTATNEAITETGSARPVITVERHEFRNRNTTRTVRSAPSISAPWTSATELATRGPASRAVISSTPAGSVALIRSTCFATRPLTSVALYPSALMMSMPTAARPLKSAAVRGSSVPSRASATSPSRTSRPLRCVTTSCAKSAGVSSRPLSRIVRSSSEPLSRPTGAARFCACSAWTTSPTLDAGRLQRLRLQLDRHLALDAADHAHFRDAGHAAQLADDAGIGEPRELGSRQRPGRRGQLHDRQVVRIEPREDRLLHLGRQVVPDLRDAVADVLRRLLQVLLEDELDRDHAEAVERVRLDLLDAADRRDLLLDRIDDLALDGVGRRARVGDRDRDDRRRDVGELVGLQGRQREHAEDRQRKHRDDRDDRPPNGEIRDEHLLLLRR